MCWDGLNGCDEDFAVGCTTAVEQNPGFNITYTEREEILCERGLWNCGMRRQ